MSLRFITVDDDLKQLAKNKAWLEAGGYEVVGQYSNGKEALKRIRELNPDGVVLDNQLLEPPMGDAIALELLNENLVKYIFMATSRSVAAFDHLYKRGVTILHKPYHRPDFLQDILEGIRRNS